MPRIAISYRRRDSAAITGRIFDRLVGKYGADSVFRDVDNIPDGVDYRKYIAGAIEKTDVLLAIIGPNWIGKNEEGRLRIDFSTDFVRIEIEMAFRTGVAIIPVLVDNACMPEVKELPRSSRTFHSGMREKSMHLRILISISVN